MKIAANKIPSVPRPAFRREDIKFKSGQDYCQAWYYRPEDALTETLPCIVMAHGFGGTRDCGLEPYAVKFAAAGFAVLLFDYRHFGASSGEPRQLFSIRRQLEDWANGIAFVRNQKLVNANRVALWGTSFSGGHVLVAAVRDGNIAAVSSQCPMMDARDGAKANLKNSGLTGFLLQGVLGMADAVGSLFGRPPIYVPLVGRPGVLAAMNSPDSVSGYGAITPPGWRNQVCIRYALTIASYRPIAYARAANFPALIQVCTNDRLAPAASAIRTARKIGKKAELQSYDCEHFDIYLGEHFERASTEQLEFFDRVLRSRAV